MSTREDFVDVPGARLFVRQVGDGPALVLVNGGPGMSHDYMRPLEAIASATLRVVTYDQRGCGRSAFPDPPRFHMRDYVADLEAIRAHLALDSIHLLGHSWGGLVCQAFAGKHPRRVASLTLVGSMAPWFEDNRGGQQELQDRIDELSDLGIIPNPMPKNEGDSCKATSLAMLPAYLADPEQPTPGPLEDTAFSTSVYHATIDRLGGYDLRQRLRELVAPTTIFIGQLDPFGTGTARATARSLAGAFPEIVVLPGVGHYPWLEREDFVNELRSLMHRRLETPSDQDR